MPQFTLPNIVTGGRITVNASNLANAQQAAASQTGVSLDAQQAGGTFGGNTFGAGAGGGGGTGGSGGQVQDFAGAGGLAQFAAQTSGVTQAQLDQQKREFDAQLAFAREQMEKLGLPQLQINQQLAALQQRQFDLQIAQTTGQLTGYYQQPGWGGPQPTLALGQLMGTFGGQPTQAAQEFAQQQALAAQQQAFQQALQAAQLNLQQAGLGQQYLATAAQLQGPQNTFQLSNYLRGAQGNPQVPTYIQALAKNLGLPAFQAPGTTAPTPQTAGGIGAQLIGGQSATPGWDYGSTAQTIQNIMGRGAQGLPPGTLERLTPEELQAFGSGMGALGGSLPAFLSTYQTSRVGQTAPLGQPGLA